MATPKTYGTFIKTNDRNEAIERTAYSPSEAVNLRFDGWVEKPAATSGTGQKPAASTSNTKP